MSTENGELLHECFPKHFRMGTARLKQRQKVERNTVDTKNKKSGPVMSVTHDSPYTEWMNEYRAWGALKRVLSNRRLGSGDKGLKLYAAEAWGLKSRREAQTHVCPDVRVGENIEALLADSCRRHLKTFSVKLKKTICIENVSGRQCGKCIFYNFTDRSVENVTQKSPFYTFYSISYYYIVMLL